MASRPRLAQLNPQDAAEQLFAAHKDERAWLDAFTEHLDRQRSGESFARTLSVWGLSQAEAARLLGVSRQAVGKWREQGIPANWKERVADLAATTDLLVHYLKRDRIPAVVRRPIPARQGASLLQLLAQGESGVVLETCRNMFDFSQTQA
jgi:hypothetical protein